MELLLVGPDALLVLIARSPSIVAAARAVLWMSDRVSRLACLMAAFCMSLALQRFAPWPAGAYLSAELYRY